MDGNNSFKYLACVEVENIDHVPDRMVQRTIPSAQYAVFTHKGTVGENKLDDLYKTLNYIYGTWLPDSNYELDKLVSDFELYDERFCSDKPEFDIYVPIK